MTPVPLYLHASSNMFRTQHGRSRYPMVLLAAGQRVEVHEGENAVWLPPGRVEVSLCCLYFGFRVGKASVVVDAVPGGSVRLYYAPPHNIYSAGELSREPVSRPGKHVNAILVAVALGLTAVLVLILMLMSASG